MKTSMITTIATITTTVMITITAMTTIKIKIKMVSSRT